MFMRKLGRRSYIHFVNIFLSIHFHHIYVIQYTDLFTPNYIWYIFLCSWEHWAKIVTSISTARKVPHSWNFIIENSRQFLFKTKDLLLQKVLINKFLEHDGMRVLSSALFSSCMIGYTMMTTLSWQRFLLLQRSQSFVRKNPEQTERTSDVPDYFVCHIKACKLKIMCPQF